MPKLQRYRSHQFISMDNQEGENEMGEIRYVQVPKSDLVFTIKIPTTSSENPVSAQDSIIIAFDNEVAELRASRDKWKADAMRLSEMWLEHDQANYRWQCVHCFSSSRDLIAKPIVHDADCPITMHEQLIEEDSK